MINTILEDILENLSKTALLICTMNVSDDKFSYNIILIIEFPKRYIDRVALYLMLCILKREKLMVTFFLYSNVALYLIQYEISF